MSSLTIRVLGSPQVLRNGESLPIRPKKAFALLLYLAATGTPHTRDHLATLFWPENGQRQARSALRRRLSELSHAIGAHWLLTDGEKVALHTHPELRVDLRDFAHYVSECRDQGHDDAATCPRCRAPLEAAAGCYRDDFLAGFGLSRCPDFDDWQFFQAESLRREFAIVLERLIACCEDAHELEAAIGYARRRVALDTLHEPAHRTLIRLYGDAGHYAAAVRQYELCEETLASELGVSPEAATVQLIESIRHRRTASLTEARPNRSTAEHSAEVAPQALDELRMVTLLAVDVEPVSEEEWDQRPEGVTARISTFLSEAAVSVRRKEGAVDRTQYSGFQANFGLLHSHEDDAERTLLLALELQQKAKEQGLALSAGVSTGLTYISHPTDGTSPRAIGPTVQNADRLRSAAAAGEILTDASTHHHAVQAFIFQEADVMLPHAKQASAVYTVVQLRNQFKKSRGVVGLTAPLIGRDDEFGKLKQALRQLQSGRGQLVTLTGEAGVGKSRLVSELHAEVDAANLTAAGADVAWLEGRCMEMRLSTPYWPFVDILHAYFGWTPQTSESERADSIVAHLAEWTRRGQVSQEDAPNMGQVLGVLLSLHFGNKWDDALLNASPEQVRHQTFHVLSQFIDLLTQEQPLVLVLEDLHWADPLSLDLIGELMHQIARMPLLLLCVYRLESALRQNRLAQLASRHAPDRFVPIELHELTPADSRALAEALLEVEDLPAPAKQRLLDSSQGNPFFLEEILHDLIETDLIYRDGNVWRARREIDAMAVPIRVQNVVSARMDRLPAAYKEVLQVASVCGRLFTPNVVGCALLGDADVPQALEQLEARAFVYIEQMSPYTVYSFRHVLAQEAVYQTLPGEKRARLHARIGDAIAAEYAEAQDEVVEQLAYHYDRGDQAEQAVVWLIRAGIRARNAYLSQEAVRYFQRALARMDAMEPHTVQPRWRYDALAELGKTFMRSALYEQAYKTLRQAIEWGKSNSLNATDVARLHWWLGDMLINWSGHNLEARQVSLEGLAMLEDQQSTEAGLLLGVLAFTYEISGDLDRFYETTDKMDAFLGCVPYATGLRASFGAMMSATAERKDLAGWRKWLSLANEQARRHHDDWALAEFTTELAIKEFFMGGTLEKAISFAQESLSLFHRVGDAKRVNWTEITIGDLYLDRGISEQAEAQLRKALSSAYEQNNMHMYAVLIMIASSCLAQRKWQDATQAAQQALEQAEKEQTSIAETLVLKGLASLGSGKNDQAAGYFVQALELLEDPDTCYTPRRRKWWLILNSYFASAVCGLELALDDGETFRRYYDDFRQRHPSAEQACFQHWYLEESDIHRVSNAVEVVDHLTEKLAGEWTWCDLDGGCIYAVANGLTIDAPIFRDMHWLMFNAPRMMRPVEGDFAAQVVCAPAYGDRPGVGGLLLWQDKFTYLCLTIGNRSQNEVALEGQRDGIDIVYGRGLLRTSPVWLRLERMGGDVRALCSGDGEQWRLVGQAAFPADEQLQLGVQAIGHVDRTFYWASYPDGTAMRFRDFRLWT